MNVMIHVEMSSLIEKVKQNISSIHFIDLKPEQYDVLCKGPTSVQEKLIPNTLSHDWNFISNHIVYHSRRDITRETQRIVTSFNLQPEMSLILLGCGLGYTIEYIIQRDEPPHMLLIEPDLEVLFYLLARLAWSQYQYIDRLSVFIPQENNENHFESMLSFLKNRCVKNIQVYNHIPSLQAHPSLYQPLKVKLTKLIEMREVNQATLARFENLWNKNIFLNLTSICRSQGISILHNIAQGLPVIIAGAGPSLLSHMHILKQHRKKYILLSVDTAYLPMLNHGIIPDIALCADPQWINHHFVLSRQVKDTLWVLDPVTCYAISHWLEQTQARMLWWNSELPLFQIVKNLADDMGNIKHGGSISTNAFDLAMQMSAQKIILVGHDFAFTGGLVHTKGAALESLQYTTNDRFHTAEQHNYKQLTALPRLPVKSMTQKTIYTNAKLNIFIQWFESQAKKISRNLKQTVQIFQADSEGVDLDNFSFLDIATFLDTCADCKQPIQVILDSPDDKVKNDIAEIQQKLCNYFGKLCQDISYIMELCKTNIHHSYQYLSQPNTKWLHLLEVNDRKILTYKDAYQILSLSMQKTIFGITQVESTEIQLEAQDAISNSLKFYKSMYQASKYTLYLISKISSH